MIIAIHIFFDNGRKQGWIDGSYDCEGSALRGLADLFYHDPRSAFDYWHTAVFDKTTGKTTYLDWTYAAERKADALRRQDEFENPKTITLSEYEAIWPRL